MTYTVKYVSFTLAAPFQKNLGRWLGLRALPALYGSYAHTASHCETPLTALHTLWCADAYTVVRVVPQINMEGWLLTILGQVNVKGAIVIQ